MSFLAINSKKIIQIYVFFLKIMYISIILKEVFQGSDQDI